MTSLSHVSQDGSANMVDVGGKAPTWREARASARVETRPDVIEQIQQAAVKKGDVLASARIAGIMAAKQTSQLIPLCHPLALTKVSVDFELDADAGRIYVASYTKVQGPTGVEMEALTAASVAALTLYDMCKALDPAMTINALQLEEKQGGKLGHWRRDDHD